MSIENTLWANTIVASGTAIGFVIYTGLDTRAAKNTNFPKTKVGALDLEVNQLSKILAIVTFLLSLLMVGMNGFRGMWYIYIFRFLILFSSIIPISLRVNLDMGKAVYAMQIMRDKNIPDTIVRSSTIPEELGRIEYLLTDKTGTLTKNDMELKRIHLGTMSYSSESMDEITSLLKSAYKNDTRFKRARDIGAKIKDVVQALALCHNVSPVNDPSTSVIEYQASSPDEMAIVKWTKSVGLVLFKRDLDSIELSCPDSSLQKFLVLHIFPFTSETKRMGIIVRECQSGEIIYYLKGAVYSYNLGFYNE